MNAVSTKSKGSPRKVAIVTGANSGIGRVTARELALRGYHVFLACRSEAKTRRVLDEIRALGGVSTKAEFLPLDLSDLASVRRCADMFLSRGLPLHLLVANAGLAGQKGKTASGFELTFGTCHVGHFLLTKLLQERLVESAPARVVVVASMAHRHSREVDFDRVRRETSSPGGLREYSVAKLANVLFTRELAKRLEGSGVTTYSLHPGTVATNVWRAVPWPVGKLIKRFMLTDEQGACTTLYCATAPELASISGRYYDESREAEPSAAARDDLLARRLWEATESWVQAV